MNKRDYNINPKQPSDKDLERFKDFDKVISKVQAPQNSFLKVVKSKWFFAVSAGLILASAVAFYLLNKPGDSKHAETAVVETAASQGEAMAQPESLADPVASLASGESKRRIQPPIPQWDVPYEIFDIDADKGGELLSKNGSAIHIKPQSFMDRKGNTIHGMISIRYREFHDPLGIFLAGVPMEYDTAGKTTTFESAGMVELLAEKANNRIELRNGKEIGIDLVSLSREEFNVYYFDTTAGKWEYINESETKPYVDLSQTTTAGAAPAPEPVLPAFREQEKETYSFSAQVDFNQFPELNKDVIFEVDDSLIAFDPLLYDVRWDNITLKKSKYKGHYSLFLKRGSKEVTVEAFPVLSSAKYAEAMSRYHSAQDAFEKSKYVKSEFSYSYMDAEASAVQKEISQLLRVGTEQKKMYKEKLTFRPLVMRMTGMVNCDTPITFTESYPLASAIQPAFTNKKDSILTPKKIYNVAGKKNALFTNNAGSTVYYSKKDNNTMWVLLPDETIGIASPDDFKRIKSDTHKFTMDVYSSVEGLKRLKTVMNQ